jgi:Flp pilus assembly protein TadD
VCNGELKQFKEAKRCFHKALALSPDDVHSLGNLGEICRLLGDLADSRKYLEKGLELAQEPADRNLLLCSLSELKRAEAAAAERSDRERGSFSAALDRLQD